MNFRTCISKIPVLMAVFALIGCVGIPPATTAENNSPPTTPVTSAGSNGLALDTAIEQAAGRIENAFAAGTEIALVSVSSSSTQFSEYVLTYLETVLVNNGKLAIVDRSNLDRIREEQGFQLSGEVSDESAKAIGQLLGAGAIVTGGLVNLGDVHRLNLKAINVETARIAASYSGDIAGSPRVQTLLASGGGGGGAGGTAAASAGGQAAAPASALVDGTYTFYPRPRASQAGVDKDLYLDRIVIKGEYFTVFFTGAASGRGGDGDYGPFWNISRTNLQDLDNPRRTYNPVNNDEDDVTGGFYLTFQGITPRRFTITGQSANPHYVFENITMGEPD